MLKSLPFQTSGYKWTFLWTICATTFCCSSGAFDLRSHTMILKLVLAAVVLLVVTLTHHASALDDKADELRARCTESMEQCVVHGQSAGLDLRDSAEFDELAKDPAMCCQALTYLKCLREKNRTVRDCRTVPGFTVRDINTAERKLRRNRCMPRNCRTAGGSGAGASAGGNVNRVVNANRKKDEEVEAAAGVPAQSGGEQELDNNKKNKRKQQY